MLFGLRPRAAAKLADEETRRCGLRAVAGTRWLRSGLWLLGAAFRDGGRGRLLFLWLLRWSKLVLLFAELVRELPAGIAEVELQDRLADVLMRPVQHALPERCPVEIALTVTARE